MYMDFLKKKQIIVFFFFMFPFFLSNLNYINVTIQEGNVAKKMACFEK